MSSVGVVIDGSFGATERLAPSALTAAMLVLVTSEPEAASRSGSQRLCGTSAARYCTRPDFDSPCGASAVVRFVHVMIGTIALNGTPADAAFQTAPPPREMPSAPICVSEISGRAVSHVKSSRVSCTSRGPSSPKRPSETTVASRVAFERRVAGGREEPRRDRLHVLMPSAEAVEEHRGGPAAGRRRAVRLDERAGELRAVGRRDRQLLRGRRETPSPRKRAPRRAMTARKSGRPKTGVRVALLYDHRVDTRPIGVFDSGVGGLTVLHECLVTMPQRGLRLPRRPRSPAVRPAAARSRCVRSRTRSAPISRRRT